MPAMQSRLAFVKRLATLTILVSVAGCGGDDGTPTVIAAASVAATPGSTAVTTAQPLTVAVTVHGNGPTTATGTVTLTSGAFNAGAIALANGAATIVVPAGVLAPGSDTLTLQYAPDPVSPYPAAAGATAVTVSPASLPAVSAQSTSIATHGHPFEALPVGSDLLVSVSANLDPGSVTGIRVYSATSPAQPTFRCTQTASHPNHAGMPLALGLAAAPNGLGIAVAIDDAGLDLLNGASISTCTSPETIVSQGDIATVQGTFAVTITPDGRYAFVANEYGVVATDSAGANILGNVGVVALQYDATGHLSGGSLVGRFSTGGQAIANVTLSPDGRRLYVTSEIAHPGIPVAGTGNPTLAHGNCVQPGTDANGNPITTISTYGLLTVVDVAKAEASPDASAIIATVAAGCSPVRVVETADQQVVWVAARGDNAVLAFSTHALETNPGAALLGAAGTGGTAPVGLLLFHGGQLLAVANSNRFSSPAAVGNMTIMAATPVAPSVVATVPAFYFPRSIDVATDGSTLYLTDYDSATLQVVTTNVQ